jgi:8-oxo-dGTP pyrophosphatase MutT (NUDIX family)
MKLKHSLDIDPIQLCILTILNSSKKGKRFSELNTKDLTSDHFAYHINYLLDRDYIEKKKSKYYITFRGKKLMSDIDIKGKKYDLFRFSVTVNVVKEIGGKKHILVQKRNRYPYMDDVNTIAGKVKQGESVKDTAIRKFNEETGLTISDVNVLGILRKVREDEERNLIEDVIYTVCYAKNPIGKLQEKNDWGEHWWSDIDDFLDIQKENIDFGKYDREVMLRIRDENFNTFYFEQFARIEQY